MQTRNRAWLVLALFLCSGATALVYEVVWSKFLSQMFGSTIYAQTAVLAAFMGGLALGNKLFGRWADRAPKPLQVYGLLEIAIGIYALLFPALDRFADRIFVAVGSHIAERAGWLFLLKGALSALLLLGPTILMGGTLPLLAAWLQKSTADPGRRSAQFYAVNSLGAVAGAGLAGFWLVQTFGLITTLWVTAAANLLVGTAAILLSRISAADFGSRAQAEVAQESTLTRPSDTLSHPTRRADAPSQRVGEGWGEGTGRGSSLAPETLHWAGLTVALTGAVSMGLEVLSARSLALIFGSSLQTFAVVLMAFILGIGLGSAWIASAKRGGRSGERQVVILLCLAAVWVLLLVFNIERWVDVYRIAHTGLGRTEIGYLYHQALAVGMSLVIIGFPAACIGAVLPLMIRAASSTQAILGAQVGRLLTWNTLGAVVGTLLTGFVLMPGAGVRNAFVILALVLAIAAFTVAWRRGWRAAMGGALVPCALAGLVLVLGGDGWRHSVGMGIFRLRESEFDPRFMPMIKEHVKILYYEDAPDATVLVEEVDGVIGPRNIGLRINGKPDAGTSLNTVAQMLMGHLPMLAKPEAKDVFLLGLGTGMTAGAVLSYPVESLVVAENCEPVIGAARVFFQDWNRCALDDPRTRVYAEDGRTVLKLRPQLFDVIIAEPSNPWTVGVGSIFSREYYEIAASRLKPGGLVAQWFHIYEMDDHITELVLRTFASVFPYVEIWDCATGDIAMLGSFQPWPTGPEVFRKGFAIDRVRSDLWMVDIASPEAVMARQLASQRTGFAIGGSGPIQSDLRPVLEYHAPKAFYIGDDSRFLDVYDERTRQQLLAPPEKLQVLHGLPPAQARVVFDFFSSVNGELAFCIMGAPAAAAVPCVFQTPRPSPPPGAGGTILDAAATAFAIGDLDQAGRITAFALQQNPGDRLAQYVSRVVERERRLRPAGK